MWNKNDIRFFRRAVLGWFSAQGRHFPWREIGVSNYELLFSEILLQRTKAETVARYYNTFFEKYPDWETLVKATDKGLEEILIPLGLYRHRAARIRKIIDEYKQSNGFLPVNINQLHGSAFGSLYISNAYQLFLLKKRAALLDVNMSRVLRRFFEPREYKDVRNDKLIQELAHNVVNVRACKELNWAILDIAALVCKARKPQCEVCPLMQKCRFTRLSLKDKLNCDSAGVLSISTGESKPNSPPRNGEDLKIVSLFSGCGGMDLGFDGGFIVHRDSINEVLSPHFVQKKVGKSFVKLKSTRFRTVFANDILPEAKSAWINYFKKRDYSPDTYHLESVVDLVKLHKQGHSVFPSGVDVVTGGFPCQDFSVAGKRNGFNSHKDHTGKIIKDNVPSIETRGQLYMWMKEVIELIQPKIFIAENVKGLVNLSNVKSIIQKDFSSINGNGYLVLDPLVLHAADYGVPQSRERVIFIGIKKSELRPEALKELSKVEISEEYFPYPKPTHAYRASGQQLKSPVQLASIFAGLAEPGSSDDPSQNYYSRAKFMGKHCQGQKEVNLKSIGPTIRAEHHGNIEFRRLSLANGGRQVEELTKMKLKQRRLTPRECALIQTFPPDYEFVIPSDAGRFSISASSAYKIIGNAVPPLLAYHLAMRIESLWDLYFNHERDGNIVKSGATKRGFSITT